MRNAVIVAALLAATPVAAQKTPTPDVMAGVDPSAVGPDLIAGRFALHAQATFVAQGNTPFRAPYDGPNSLNGDGQFRETADITLYGGVRLWKGFEAWANGEADQGFGLRNTLGAAGFPSAEAYKVGKGTPYIRLQRLFFRQTIDLGGDADPAQRDLNQLAVPRTANRLTLTVGKFSVGDIFDTNTYAHDPRNDFLNWTTIDLGTFDYAADAWGYTYGGAAELTLGKWTGRAGLFNLSQVPNSADLETHFRQYQVDLEVERRISFRGHPGAIRVTGWFSHGNFARLDDAVAYGRANGTPPQLAPVRRFRDRKGIGVDAEQEVADNIGVFFRAGVGDGDSEVVEFTDADSSVSGGARIKGKAWGRGGDEAGIALIANDISAARKRFLDAGGLGLLIGDGRLPHLGPELIGEAYYDVTVVGPLHLTADAQLIVNPAYNRDRGPVPVFGIRAHVQY
ncbi:MAG: carbohydrate porin [Sphingomonadaceae bacterium]|nr:carbohydrate porin [Sphingomonadaceae bacterium]